MRLIAFLRQHLLWAGLLIAAVLVVVLARQLATVRGELERVVVRATRPRVGLFVPTVDLPRLDGGIARVGATTGGRRQLLIAFTTTCPFCRASHAAWRRLDSARAADPAMRDVEVYGVATDSTDSLASYVANAQLAFPVVAMRGKELTFYRLGMVPALMLLDSTGRTLYYRAGVLPAGPVIDSVLGALRDSRTVPARPGPPPCPVKRSRGPVAPPAPVRHPQGGSSGGTPCGIDSNKRDSSLPGWRS